MFFVLFLFFFCCCFSSFFRFLRVVKQKLESMFKSEIKTDALVSL